MSAPTTLAEAIRSERLIDTAWDAWAKQEPTSGTEEDEAAWQAGYEAFEEASCTARDVVRVMPCRNLTEVANKLSWLLSQDPANPDLSPYQSALRDLTSLLDRPTQDAFAVKLARYYEAVGSRNTYEGTYRPTGGEGLTAEYQAFERAMSPLHDAVFDHGKAVLLEPAPDIAALIAKRAIFDALEFWSAGEEPEVFTRLFADAVALAGGAA